MNGPQKTTADIVISAVAQPGSPSLLDDDYREEVNKALADVTDSAYETASVGFNEIQEVLSQYEIYLPESNLMGQPGVEQIYPLIDYSKDEMLYLYFYFDAVESGKAQFYVEICNDAELESLQNDFDVDDDTSEEDPQEMDW